MVPSWPNAPSGDESAGAGVPRRRRGPRAVADEVRTSTPTERETMAERIAARLDVPITVAGILFVLVIVADRMTSAESPLSTVWTVAVWGLWTLFVVEFALRLVIAPSTRRFLRRNWWQLAFLAVPFLRFLRSFTRAARLARVASTSVRTTRTAGQALLGRVGWLVGITVGTILGGSEVLFEFGEYATYQGALHDVTLSAIGGLPLEETGAVADVLEVVLVIHATVIFAALAGSLGAFFLERREASPTPSPRGSPRGVGS
jgi:voltage-gated potassium channel